METLSTKRFFLIHTKYASIRSSCIYEDVNYPFEDDLYILKLTLTVLSLVIRDRVLNFLRKFINLT